MKLRDMFILLQKSKEAEEINRYRGEVSELTLQGKTIEEALANIKEALELYYSE